MGSRASQIGAAHVIKVGNVYLQSRRLWVREREKGGKVWRHVYVEGIGISNRGFRATEITAYMKKGGVEKVAAMANGTSTRTTSSMIEGGMR